MNVQSHGGPSNADRDRGGGGGDLTVEVFSPRVPEPKKFSWSKSLRVGDAAAEAARAFDYEAGAPTLQNKEGKILDRDKTLIEAGIRDFDQLELTDKGGGV